VHYEYTDGENTVLFHEYADGVTIKKYTGFLRYDQALAYAILFILGAAGNVIILIIIICNKEMRTAPNIYIFNLAISDLISLITNLPLAHIDFISRNWLYSDFLCKIFEFSRRVSIFLSAYSVALLSIQRHRVTVNPIKIRVHSPVTWRVTTATICGVWFLASLFALPSALSKTHRHQECARSGTYYNKVVWFELLAFCILPLCVIVFFYVMTARHLVKSAIPISEGIQHPQAKRRKNTAKIVLGLCIVFVISYVPYHITWAYLILQDEYARELEYRQSITAYVYETDEIESVYTYHISKWLLVINSCLNPVALFCTSLAFRRPFKRCLMCFKLKRAATVA
jgi:hypothetical protein